MSTKILGPTPTPDREARSTPGPWAVKGPWGKGFRIWQKSKLNQARAGIVATAELAWKGSAETQANAYLLAAAPELLQACEDFVAKVDCGAARSTQSYNQMKSAISKAYGETP